MGSVEALLQADFWRLFGEITSVVLGGPTSIFFEHLSTDKIIEDLVALYGRLVDLGLELEAEFFRG